MRKKRFLTSASDLRGTYWKLVSLENRPVQEIKNPLEPHLIFATYAPLGSIYGFGSCNRIMGRFELDGQNLRLIRLGGSMMPCPAFEQEQRFLQLLQRVRSYRISGNHLELLDPAGEVAARFRGKILRSQKSPGEPGRKRRLFGVRRANVDNIKQIDGEANTS